MKRANAHLKMKLYAECKADCDRAIRHIDGYKGVTKHQGLPSGKNLSNDVPMYGSKAKMDIRRITDAMKTLDRGKVSCPIDEV